MVRAVVQASTARAALASDAFGRVTFTVKPPKKGTIFIQATKASFKTANAKITVRTLG